MPSCFQLTCKGESEPDTLVHIDELMCEHFKQPVRADRYLCDWYDSIGMRIAIGKTLPEVIEIFEAYQDEARANGDPAHYDGLVKIAKWLNENYTTNSWRGM